MKAVLAIGLAESLVPRLLQGLRERGRSISLLETEPETAVVTLRSSAFDLIVLALPLPSPELVAALTENAESAPGTSLLWLGAAPEAAVPSAFSRVEVLSPPFSLEDLISRVAVILQRGVKGRLENVVLASLSQLFAIDKETCTLHVDSEGRTGMLYFVGGELCDAEIGDRHGEEVALEILAWEIATVDMSLPLRSQHRSVFKPLTYLLMEAMRRKDEGQREPLAVPVEVPVLDERAESHSHGLIATLSDELEGFVAAAVVDLESGAMLAADIAVSRLDFNLELASQLGGALLREEIAALQTRGFSTRLAEVLLTFDDEIQLLRLSSQRIFLYLVVDRQLASFANVRAALHEPWAAFEASCCPPEASEAGRPPRPVLTGKAAGG